AQRRDRAVATVTVARPLTARQTTKLGDALAAEYGRQVHLNVIVDAAVLGGVRVEIGDEVIDGTMHTRLEIVRRRLTG
nr:F0F1 ATP synthase subunit delta [Nocardioidaceae bacterium]